MRTIVTSREPWPRRDFLKAGVATVGSLLAASAGTSAASRVLGAEPPARKLRLLILGGSGFIGPWMAELAVARGHHVTLFNRGRREKLVGSTDGVEKLYGNRDPRLHAQSKVVDGKEVADETSPKGLSELEGKKWDAVIDNSGYVPRIVQASAELLAPNVGQYLFISTMSVYKDTSKPGTDESGELATIDSPESENIQRHYGPLKALCEKAAETAMPGRVTVLRPGYIVGPGDTTDRFTYWPIRTSRGGEMLVPGSPEDPVQFIDVRDLADFTLRCVENQLFGVYNLTGPKNPFSVGQLMAACLAASTAIGSDKASFTYVPYQWLAANGCPVGTLPILLPGQGRTAGFHRRDISKAIQAGAQYRSPQETCEALVKWWPEEIKLRAKIAEETNREPKARSRRATPVSAAKQLRAGISPEMEVKLLSAWSDAQQKAGEQAGISG